MIPPDGTIVPKKALRTGLMWRGRAAAIVDDPYSRPHTRGGEIPAGFVHIRVTSYNGRHTSRTSVDPAELVAVGRVEDHLETWRRALPAGAFLRLMASLAIRGQLPV